jgi:hypothetical protein
MPKMRFYGTICPVCKRSIGLGKIELRDGAQLQDLRHALSQTGWRGETAKCGDPKCGGIKMCGTNDLIFLDL